MHKPITKLKWTLFIFLLATQIFLTWKALEFDWTFIVIAAIWPVVALESAGIRPESCYEFICMPNAAGWTLCLVVWGGTHYLVAKLLSNWAMRE